MISMIKLVVAGFICSALTAHAGVDEIAHGYVPEKPNCPAKLETPAADMSAFPVELNNLADIEAAEAQMVPRLRANRDDLTQRLSAITARPATPAQSIVSPEMVQLNEQIQGMAADLEIPAQFNTKEDWVNAGIGMAMQLFGKKLPPTVQQFLKRHEERMPDFDRVVEQWIAAIADTRHRADLATGEVAALKVIIEEMKAKRDALSGILIGIQQRMEAAPSEELKKEIAQRLYNPLMDQINGTTEVITSHETVVNQKKAVIEVAERAATLNERRMGIIVPAVRTAASVLQDIEQVKRSLDSTDKGAALANRVIVTTSEMISQVYGRVDASRSQGVLSVTAMDTASTTLKTALDTSATNQAQLAEDLRTTLAEIDARNAAMQPLLADANAKLLALEDRSQP